MKSDPLPLTLLVLLLSSVLGHYEEQVEYSLIICVNTFANLSINWSQWIPDFLKALLVDLTTISFPKCIRHYDPTPLDKWVVLGMISGKSRANQILPSVALKEYIDCLSPWAKLGKAKGGHACPCAIGREKNL